MPHKHVGLFFLHSSPSPELLVCFGTSGGASIEKIEDNTRVIVRFPNALLQITVDANWQRDLQIAGIRGWINRFPEETKTLQPVQRFLLSLEEVVTCYGVVIESDFEMQGEVVSFLLKILEFQEGFMFSEQAFYDRKGVKIIGLPQSPETFGFIS